MRRLLAIDPSLTCSGWALFNVGDGKLLAVGKVKSLKPSHPLALRLARLQQCITEVFQELGLGCEDCLVCEDATTMRDPNAALKVEQVRGLFEVMARQLGMRVPGRINPRSVQSEILGLSGRQQSRELVKAAAVQCALTLYGKMLKKIAFSADNVSLKRHQDIVDAILIGHLALCRLQAALKSGYGLEEYLELSARESQVSRFNRRKAA